METHATRRHGGVQLIPFCFVADGKVGPRDHAANAAVTVIGDVPQRFPQAICVIQVFQQVCVVIVCLDSRGVDYESPPQVDLEYRFRSGPPYGAVLPKSPTIQQGAVHDGVETHTINYSGDQSYGTTQRNIGLNHHNIVC